MTRSPMQELFMREWAKLFIAARAGILNGIKDKSADDAEAAITDSLQGLYHALLVTFDGGTSLADHGLIQIVDEDGIPFDRYLHEICFSYWPSESRE